MSVIYNMTNAVACHKSRSLQLNRERHRLYNATDFHQKDKVVQLGTSQFKYLPEYYKHFDPKLE